jgi:hypothetical protein
MSNYNIPCKISKNSIQLLKHLTIHSLVIPIGFISDGNSVPRVCRPFIGSYDYLPAAILHDFIYQGYGRTKVTTRKEADKLYRDLLIYYGCSKAIAYSAYYLLRIFGKKNYKREKLIC